MRPSLLAIIGLAAADGARTIAPGSLLSVAPCNSKDANQQLRVNAAAKTVESSDGTLCVTYVGESPTQLAMAPCLPGAANQSWTYNGALFAFEGNDGGGCVAWNSQGDVSALVRPLSTWTCASLQWNGIFSPNASQGVIIANCSSPDSCAGDHCVVANPPPPSCHASPCVTTYNLSDALGPARVFEGVGGLSGGGGVARLLPSYSAALRSEILDYLFLPGFGASLQVLKVEIGSECQSTDGSEATHSRTPTDADFSRGYEWDMMREAKARNPAIKLFGLAWGFPRWVTCAPATPMLNCTGDIYSYPEQTAAFMVSWVRGARDAHNLTIDFVGSWNERPFDVGYLKILRAALDAAGFRGTGIVAPDQGGWEPFASDVLGDPALEAALHALGSHYPGTTSDSNAEETGLSLWASEVRMVTGGSSADYSCVASLTPSVPLKQDASNYNNNVGGGCWARSINQNYVNGNSEQESGQRCSASRTPRPPTPAVTSSIAWNLISAYSKGYNWYRCGLMNAMQPWAGSYGTFGVDDSSWSAGPMIWASAHTAQFSAAGSWSYLAVGPGGGAGTLIGGGSYVTLIDSASANFTVVVEKLSAAAACIRPGSPGPSYGTTPERATFQLAGQLAAAAASLHVWRTHWAFGGPGDETAEFVYEGTLPVVGGAVTLDIDMDSVYTLTTLAGGRKGSHGIPAPPSLFPGEWEDDFEACVPPAEAPYVCDMSGAMECAASGDPAHGVILAMRTPLIPVPSGGDLNPHSLIGALDTVNMSLSIDAQVPAGGGALLIGVRAQHNNYDTAAPNTAIGALLEIAVANASAGSGEFSLWASAGAAVNGTAPLLRGPAPGVLAGAWHSYRLDANGSAMRAWLDGTPLFPPFEAAAGLIPPNGHALLGAPGWGNESGLPAFDNLRLYSSFSACGADPLSIVPGAPVSVVQCSSEAGVAAGAVWTFNASAYPPAASPGRLSLLSAPGLCLAAGAGGAAVLAPCDAGDAAQAWRFTFVNALNSRLASVASGLCLDNSATGDPARAVIGTALSLVPCRGGDAQSFHFDTASGQLVSVPSSTCAGVC